jgi:hypothetical protein
MLSDASLPFARDHSIDIVFLPIVWRYYLGPCRRLSVPDLSMLTSMRKTEHGSYGMDEARVAEIRDTSRIYESGRRQRRQAEFKAWKREFRLSIVC